MKQGVEAGNDQFVIRLNELAEAYGTGAKKEILEDLGTGWEARTDEEGLIVSRNIPKEVAIEQLGQRLGDLVGSLG
ncbi:hypothetical protein GCM10007884_23700 [Methylobacterium brachythecii]|uniref:Uncharacterized protein n=1 Tax=Methylobacterium brachythecii TaxID=1176177 RepID=A0ABQ6D202_9HYPH|nr:hypothetical protein GCM10007884_23700 [Methylobacterium brachythecii]